MPGLALTRAMNSLSVWAAILGLTVMTLGTLTRLVMGVKSFSGSYGVWGLVAGLVAIVLTVATPSV
ncbi:Uncharacterised protein [Bordetella pertussis]|nr:Uncharacterised protein [Bordetella pertussis]CFO80835.1 Uncharacterised protein [Bordetella pertussis]CPN88675.1 Uncharacterised protein [Bordetella pertussis]